MKKYKFGLRFQKYDHTEIITVTSLEEIRPIAKGVAYDLLLKNDVCPKPYNRVKCELYALGEHKYAPDYMLMYINPVPFYTYQNRLTGELLKNNKEKRQSFFRCLFRHHKIAKFTKLEYCEPLITQHNT